MPDIVLDPFQLKYPATGSGAPSTLAIAELAYDPGTGILYAIKGMTYSGGWTGGTIQQINQLPISFGTGVQTALAVNVGSAGAVVTNGGALGTPSSGNLGTCTGYPTDTSRAPAAAAVGTVGITIDGGGVAISAGTKGYLVVPFGGTINAWYLVGDVSGSIAMEVWKIAAGTTLPTSGGNKISGTDPPAISTNVAASNTGPLSNWTATAVTAGDIFGFAVTGTPASITRATLTLKITKS